jgi:class 3 adenylate cyclase
MQTPETRYAVTDDGVHIAYHTVGDGPVDLLYLHTFQGGLEMLWEEPRIRSISERFGSFARVIRHDMRGTGLSDRHTALPDLETQGRDIDAVLDAVGSYAVVIFTPSNPVGPFFAATRPARTRALIFFDPAARAVRTADYPWGMTEAEAAHEEKNIVRTWGRDSHAGSMIADVAPSLRGDREVIRWYARLCRHWVAPGDAAELMRQFDETDLRDVLPTIDVPTLCVVRRSAGGTDEAAFVTGLIPDAKLVVLEGEDRWSAAGDQDALVGAVRDFLGAAGSGREATSPLRALLFTDIVDSTVVAERLGDAAWAELLGRHNALVRAGVVDADGSIVDSAGDGFFAGPARAVRCARGVVEAVRDLGIEIRAGVHTGEVETVDGKPGGIAVHVAARVAALGGPSEVLVTRTVKDLVAGSRLSFTDAGEHELKGVTGAWQLYRVTAI